MSDEIGLHGYRAEVLPDEKTKKLSEVQSRGFVVAVMGYGVNDTTALATADVGIGIDADTEVTIQTADIVLVRSLLRAVAILALSRETYRKMIQVLAWATGNNIFAIPLTAGRLYDCGIPLSRAAGPL